MHEVVAAGLLARLLVPYCNLNVNHSYASWLHLCALQISLQYLFRDVLALSATSAGSDAIHSCMSAPQHHDHALCSV